MLPKSAAKPGPVASQGVCPKQGRVGPSDIGFQAGGTTACLPSLNGETVLRMPGQDAVGWPVMHWERQSRLDLFPQI